MLVVVVLVVIVDRSLSLKAYLYFRLSFFTYNLSPSISANFYDPPPPLKISMSLKILLNVGYLQSTLWMVARE